MFKIELEGVIKMSKEIDLTKYQVRTDLAIETLDPILTQKGIKQKVEVKQEVKITTVDVLEEGVALIKKKAGKYITIEFGDITDHNNQEIVTTILEAELKKMLKYLKLKETATCLIIGLGNAKSTPDALGPLVLERVVVTKHLFELEVVNPGFRSVATFAPGVMGQTGIETSAVICGIVAKVKPDFVIVIDALAASSLARINKTIQITDTGIHPGSGVGNARQEINAETLGVPVLALGVPTVVDAVTIVNDTINYISKKIAFNKTNIDNPLYKLVAPTKGNYLNGNDLSTLEKQNLMGLLGTLTFAERRELIKEVLTPLGYNLMVTTKDIDFLMEKLSILIANSINQALHRQIKQA